MSDFRVSPDELDRGAQQVEQVAEPLPAVLTERTIKELPQALPGGQCAAVANAVHVSWYEESGDILRLLGELAARLRSTASNYREFESTAQGWVRRALGGGK